MINSRKMRRIIPDMPPPSNKLSTPSLMDISEAMHPRPAFATARNKLGDPARCLEHA